MPSALADGRSKPSLDLRQAVQRSRTASVSGALERIFALAFEGLVYPQIWEDPVVDMEAMRLGPGQRLIAIASGGCNVLSYLTAEPDSVLAVDLNPTHVALTRLKLEAVRRLARHADFLRFFGEARSPENVRLYDRVIRHGLDPESRRYWERRDLSGRRRITRFARGFYRYGLLGRFIGTAHIAARLCGVRPDEMLRAATVDEQRALFDQRLAPVFDRRLVRWITDRRVALYGLGIPPHQFGKLAGDRQMADVLAERLRKLACDFPVKDNYFAWQAFGRSYEPDASLPPYLERDRYEILRRNIHKAQAVRGSFTAVLRRHAAASLDRFVLLDAQDWMGPDQLDALWAEIGRTARPGARVVYRTAAEHDSVGAQVSPALLAPWTYEAEASRSYTRRDRSAVYGAFHLYVRRTPS